MKNVNLNLEIISNDNIADRKEQEFIKAVLWNLAIADLGIETVLQYSLEALKIYYKVDYKEFHDKVNNTIVIQTKTIKLEIKK